MTNGKKETHKDLFGQPDLGALCVYNIPVSNFDKDHLSDVKKALSKLRLDSFKLGSDEDEEDWADIGFISGAHYIKKESAFKIELSQLLIPYIIELNRLYTSINPFIYKTFSGKYTFRFYEWCCQYRDKGQFFLTVDDMRKKIRLENKYKLHKDFVKYVILPAKEELRELYDKGDCDLCFVYSPKELTIGSGRPTPPVILVYHHSERRKEATPYT